MCRATALDSKNNLSVFKIFNISLIITLSKKYCDNSYIALNCSSSNVPKRLYTKLTKLISFVFFI